MGLLNLITLFLSFFAVKSEQLCTERLLRESKQYSAYCSIRKCRQIRRYWFLISIQFALYKVIGSVDIIVEIATNLSIVEVE